MKHFEAVGLETILHEPDFLDADHFLSCIRNDEAGGGRPDVPDMAKSKIPALVHMAGPGVG